MENHGEDEADKALHKNKNELTMNEMEGMRQGHPHPIG